ncbi:LysR substrate-binding domain-containing protein [Simiduia curdlanivorans]|uniref:LysR substrate-binding domain-containing protein n=1 Tax=Simiduia curdlanivorans TaxID=1492769 RepID=A0ABV8V714_9GAMM|nr:LysR substrate-binding domain-containing protein [Simiduia curdlanivorans]MDN3639015.1 LysR substrate-binding domain-containing protein [Simiduia curdlanivorans]
MLTLEALLVLDAIDRKGSFAAAALELHKVPSALSYTVKQLESYLSLSLFDRSGQKAVLTDEGRMVLKQGRELLQGAELLTNKARQVATGWEPSLRIAVDSILPMAPLWPLVSTLSQLNPSMEIEVREEALTGCWEALADRRVDLLVGVSDTELAGLKIAKRSLGDLAFQLVCGADHPLATQYADGVLEADLKCYAQIVLRDSARHLAPRSVGLYQVRRQILVDHYYAKEQAILAGLGFGFLPKQRINHFLEDGRLVALSAIKPEFTSPLFIAWRANHTGKGVSWLVEHLMSERAYQDYLVG